MSRWIAWSCALAAVIYGAGCGSAGELRGTTFVRGDVRYQIGALEGGWRRIDVGGHNDVAFEERSLGAVVQVNSSCGHELDVPLPALTNHLLIGFTEREVVEQALRPLDGREALVTHVRAKLDGVPRELLLVVMKKDGCVYDFALVGSPDGFARARAQYEPFVGAFHVESRP